MSQTIDFDRWIMYGSGWEVSFVAELENLTVTRAYGSDYATISGKAWIKSVGGSTNTKAKFWIQLDGTWTEVNIAGSNGSGGWYTFWAGDWYSQTFSFSVSVGATAGTLSGQVCFSVYDINGPHADSEYKTYSQTYGTKGASTISSASNVTLNTSGTATSTVTFVSYSSSFTHKVKATLGSASTSEVTVAGGNSVTKTATLTFPASFINQITTAKTGTATVTLTTYSGSTSIGSSTKTITLTVPSGINPTVTINSVTKSAKVTNSFTEICTVLDAVTVGWSFTQSYSSPINSGSVNVDGTSGSNTSGTYTSGALANYGTRSVTVTATDKRGNSGSRSTTFNVYRYFYPSLSTVKFKTDNSLDIAGNIAYVNNHNVPSLVLKIYKGESTSGTTVDLGSYIGSASGGTYDASYSFNFNLPIDPQYIPDIATETYRFEVTVGDSITTATTTVYSAVAVMTFGAGGTDVTVHKPLIAEDYFSSTHIANNWDNNVDLLMVAQKYQGDAWHVYQTSGSYPTSSPFGAATAVYYRQQFSYYNPTLYHATVVLWEVYPNPSRVWVNVYNTSWQGWKSISTDDDYELYSFKTAISAGTIGTRGAQQSYTPSYTVRGLEICYINSSALYTPLVFYQHTNNTVYCNWYRATTSAINETQSEIQVKIYKA